MREMLLALPLCASPWTAGHASAGPTALTGRRWVCMPRQPSRPWPLPEPFSCPGGWPDRGMPLTRGASLTTGPGLRSGRRLRRGILQRRPFRALLRREKHPGWLGVDLSSTPCRAAKRQGSTGLPWPPSMTCRWPDQQIDLLVNCFPLAWRVSPGAAAPAGSTAMWFPAPATCGELKQVLYDTPYPNEEKAPIPRPLTRKFRRWTAPSICRNLRPSGPVSSDPYFWKTPPAGCPPHLAGLPQLDTIISFQIRVPKQDRP